MPHLGNKEKYIVVPFAKTASDRASPQALTCLTHFQGTQMIMFQAGCVPSVPYQEMCYWNSKVSSGPAHTPWAPGALHPLCSPSPPPHTRCIAVSLDWSPAENHQGPECSYALCFCFLIISTQQEVSARSRKPLRTHLLWTRAQAGWPPHDPSSTHTMTIALSPGLTPRQGHTLIAKAQDHLPGTPHCGEIKTQLQST